MDNLKKISHASVEDLQDYGANNCVSNDQGDNMTGITGCLRGRGETKKNRADNEMMELYGQKSALENPSHISFQPAKEHSSKKYHNTSNDYRGRSSLKTPSSTEQSKMPSSARDRSSSTSRSRSPTRDHSLSLHGILRCQRAKYSAGLRANSPPHPIPLQYYDKDDEPEYRKEWIKQQEIKAENLNDDDENIDNNLFTEAIKMVSDGRAQLLVESGYNMYGNKLNDGKNFFDKPFDEEYDMYDWIPRWVRLSKSRTYLP